MDVPSVAEGYSSKKNYARPSRDDTRTETVDELAFRMRAAAEFAPSHLIEQHNPKEGPASYAESYALLKAWVHGSLDMYRDELMSLLFPIFVHCYLDMLSKGFTDEAKGFLAKHSADHKDTHSMEIIQLSAVQHPYHVQNNSEALKYRKNKVNVRLSAYAFELFLRFLQESKLLLLLALVNEFASIQIREAKPGFDIDGAHAMPVGCSQAQIEALVAKHRVHWGAYPPLDGSEPTPEPAAKRRAVASAAAKPVVPVPDLDRVPQLPAHELAALQSFQEVRERLAVGSHALPSVCMYTWLNTDASLSALELSGVGTTMAAGFEDSSVTVCDLEGAGFAAFNPSLAPVPSSRLRFIGHTGPVYAVSFAPDSRSLLSASADGTVRLWSLETRSCLVPYSAHAFPVWSVDCSPLGGYFATGSHDGTARVFNTASPSALRICVGHLSDVDCVRFHPNGNYIATGSSDRTARLWDVQTGECVRVFTGHKGGVSCLAFSPDGRYLVSGGHDATVGLWDLGSGELVQSYPVHRGSVLSVAVSRESGMIASGGADHSVRLVELAADPVRGPRSAARVLFTKATPVIALRFTPVNILLAGGAFTLGKA